MYVVESGIDPEEVDLGDGRSVQIYATYPEGGAPDEEDPFVLPRPLPAFGPVPISTDFGTLALFFVTRARQIAEGPRRASLTETVHLVNGRYQAELVPKGAELADAGPWTVANRNGGVPVSVKFVSTLPWSSFGRGGDVKGEHCREDGNEGPLLMSADVLTDWKAAAEKSFREFVHDHPGLANTLERGLALMDAKIMKFEADRMRNVADIEASKLEQGAEFIEEGVMAAEEKSGTTFSY